ncbi:MAG: hypothetical protein IPQ07_21355 [Myxococcales bacterium]|nr:hypothetical protein [Myxococcales bacterium]
MGQGVLRELEDLVLTSDVGLVGLCQARGGLEQGHAGARARFAVELPRRDRDLALHRDLGRVLGREGGELDGELGAAGREPREHGALLVEEVAGDGAGEVRDRVVDASDVAVVGAPGGEPARGLEEARHHVVMTSMRALQLREAGKLHTQRGSITVGARTSAPRR